MIDGQDLKFNSVEGQFNELLDEDPGVNKPPAAPTSEVMQAQNACYLSADLRD